MAQIYCKDCGKKISSSASSCPHCGARNSGAAQKVDYNTALILSILFGWLGADRFYVGHIGLGLLKLFTFGALGVWWFIDIILFATRKIQNVEWSN